MSNSCDINTLVGYCDSQIAKQRRFSKLSAVELQIVWSSVCRQIHEQIAISRKSVSVPFLGTFYVKRLPLNSSTRNTQTISTITMKDGIPSAVQVPINPFVNSFASLPPRPYTAADVRDANNIYDEAMERMSLCSFRSRCSSLVSRGNSNLPEGTRQSLNNQYELQFIPAQMFTKLPNFKRPAIPKDHIMPTTPLNLMAIALHCGITRGEIELGLQDLLFSALKMLSKGVPRIQFELGNVAKVAFTPYGTRAKFANLVWSVGTPLAGLSSLVTPNNEPSEMVDYMEDDKMPQSSLGSEELDNQVEELLHGVAEDLPIDAPKISLVPRTDEEFLQILSIDRSKVMHYHSFTGDRLWKNGRCPICAHNESPAPEENRRKQEHDAFKEEEREQFEINKKVDSAFHDATKRDAISKAQKAYETAQFNIELAKQNLEQQRQQNVIDNSNVIEVQPSILASSGEAAKIRTGPSCYKKVVQAGIAHYPSNAPSIISDKERALENERYTQLLKEQIAEHESRQKKEQEIDAESQKQDKDRFVEEYRNMQLEQYYKQVNKRKDLQDGLENQLREASLVKSKERDEQNLSGTNKTLSMTSRYVDTKLDPYFHQLSSIQAHETLLLKGENNGKDAKETAFEALQTRSVVEVDPITSKIPLCPLLLPSVGALVSQGKSAPNGHSSDETHQGIGSLGKTEETNFDKIRATKFQLTAVDTVEAAKRETALKLYQDQVKQVQSRRSAQKRLAQLERARSLERLDLNKQCLDHYNSKVKNDFIEKRKDLLDSWTLQLESDKKAQEKTKQNSLLPASPTNTRTGKLLFL